MRMLLKTCCACVFCFAFTLPAWAQAPAYAEEPRAEETAAQGPGATHALVVSGLCRDAEIYESQRDVLLDLKNLLIKSFGVEPDNMTVLGVDAKAAVPTAATAEEVKSAFERLAKDVKADDFLIFYYKGQANVVADNLRLNLSGPDMLPEDLAQMLSTVKAGSALIVLDCPGGGLAIKSLTAPGRIIMCAARRDQPYSTRFGEAFVPALVDSRSDFDGDSRISLLEAFRATVEETDSYYRDVFLLKTETALLEDDGDGVPTQRPWEHTEDAQDGAAAARTYLGSSLQARENDK
ncbi:MAG: hypothetical protein ACYTAN_10430 [Planctomycetota bacterium]|jgi:hypothetical protein